MNGCEPCLISEIDCIRSFIFNSWYLQLHICVKWLERKIKINDTLQLLLGRHCIFDIKQILNDYRIGRKYMYSASFRAITM